MGIKDKLKEYAGETYHKIGQGEKAVTHFAREKANESYQNYKAEREYQKAEKLERREQFNRGLRQGEYERGYNIGEGRGRVTEYTEYNQKGKPVKTMRYGSQNINTGKQPQLFSGGSGKTPAKAMTDIFGSGPSGLFGGGIAWGMEPPRRAAPPMRTTHVSPSGKVTIQEPYQPKQAMQQRDPYTEFWGSPGAIGGNGKKGEQQKHPYDIF